jgi:hypothetical protein
VSWIDYDNDGRVDLFVAFRDAPNMLFHNEGARFVDVAKDMGIDDPRKTVGAVWFDMNDDGRLDVFVANQDGTLNGLFRNDGARFVDVARDLGMDAGGRPANFGSNGPSVVDYDNDGRPDLYVSSYVDRPVNERDFLFHNDGAAFTNAMPEIVAKHGATHGVQWVDFNGDGALDLALANNNPGGGHYLFRNLLPPDRARRSIQVQVVDKNGHHTRAGSEVRVLAPGKRTVLGSRLVDTGGGYCSQSVMPVHLGLPVDGKVDVEVTAMTKNGRKITRVANVDPNRLPRRVLVVKV